MTTLEEKRFVIFDAAQINVDDIVALAYQLKDGQGVDASGKPVATRVQVAVVMLENGSSVTLGGASLQKFEHWWKENVSAEKVELPADVPDPVAAAANSQPATAPAPPSAPVEPVIPPAPTPPATTPPTPAKPTSQAPIDPPAPGG